MISFTYNSIGEWYVMQGGLAVGDLSQNIDTKNWLFYPDRGVVLGGGDLVGIVNKLRELMML